MFQQAYLDEIRRVGVLFLGLLPIQHFHYRANATFVTYSIRDVDFVTCNTSTPTDVLTLVSRKPRLGDAYRKVVAQIRQTEAFAAVNKPDDEILLNDEDFEYPRLGKVSTEGIRKIRRMV